jgi:hypothetical protein
LIADFVYTLHLISSQEISRLSGALPARQSPRLRSGYLLEREGESAWGVPLSMRSREGRRLMEVR